MRILFIVPEIAPYAKVGGLADVTGALPKALATFGHDIRVVAPLHGGPSRAQADWVAHESPLNVRMGTSLIGARVWETRLSTSTVPVYFLEHNDFFGRPEVYEGPWGDHKDNDQRFSYLSKAGLELCTWLDWIPDVVHAHDWATALVPVYLNTVYASHDLGRCASVLTIHNLHHQGYCDKRILPWSGLPINLFRRDGLESMGAVNLLKGGLYHATKITTVSPRYALEIQTPEGGAGLHEVLRFRSADLLGVLNGIDTSVWNPASDPSIAAPFDAANLSGRDLCRRALIKEFHLEDRPGRPVFGVVSRLFEQKGLDLLAEVIPWVMEQFEASFVLLGTGDRHLEHLFNSYAGRYFGRFATWIGFDDARARRIYAGSDFFIMPSRFEPCGLGQLYAMRYGSIPVARRTGGLADTIHPVDERGITRPTGILFNELSAHALYGALARASDLFGKTPETCKELQINGMREDYSWERSASRYADIYRWAIETRTGEKVRS